MIDKSLNYGRQHIRKFIQESLPFQTVLDLGAGQGDDLMLALKIRPKSKAYAIESYEPYVKTLRSKGINVFQKNIEHDKLPFENESVEIIIANQVLEHSKELFWIFHEVTRLLPIGGKFIIGVPNLASLHNRILLMSGRQPTPIKSASAHVRGFTKPDMLNFIESCFPGGYELKSFCGSNFYPFPARLANTLAGIFPTLSWGIFFSFEKKRTYNKEFLDFPIVNKLETNFYLGV